MSQTISDTKRTESGSPATVATHALGGHPSAGFAAAAGEVAGAIVGSVAGAAGAVAGMILGAVAGEVAGEVLEWESERARRHEEELDEAIGVVGGDLGAARADAPPARIGAPSAASLGLGGGSGVTPAEGPIQDVDD